MSVCRNPHASHRGALLRLAVSLFGVICLAATGASAELPQRRPGLWRIATISPEIGMQTHDVCIEAGDSILGAPRENCSEPKVESGEGEVIVTFSCALRDGAREVTSLLFTGDFSSWYRAQSKRTLTKANGETPPGAGFTIDAKFLSPECPATR